jgi:hypothetical protein
MAATIAINESATISSMREKPSLLSTSTAASKPGGQYAAEAALSRAGEIHMVTEREECRDPFL